MHDTRWIAILERAVNSAEARWAWNEHMAIHMRARGYTRCLTCGEWAGVIPVELDGDPCLRCAGGIMVEACDECRQLFQQYEDACQPAYE